MNLNEPLPNGGIEALADAERRRARADTGPSKQSVARGSCRLHGRQLARLWVNTTSPAGRTVLTVFAGIAEFERVLIY